MRFSVIAIVSAPIQPVIGTGAEIVDVKVEINADTKDEFKTRFRERARNLEASIKFECQCGNPVDDCTKTFDFESYLVHIDTCH